jgi:phosphoglycolate phosphatase
VRRAFDLVVFDLDGTLVDTAPEIADAVNDALREGGWPALDEAQVARWIGHGTGELLVKALAHVCAATPDSVRGSDRLAAFGAVFEDRYLHRCGTRSRPFPGAVDTLRSLRQLGARCALVTNKDRRFTERVLAAHGLAPLLDRVVCGDSLPTRKPDPAGVLACLREFRVPSTRALFVGDSSIDVATARRAGIPVWLLPHGYNAGEPVARAEPDRVVSDFASLQAALVERVKESPA